MKLDDVAVKDFNELKGIIGQTKAIGNSGNIDVNAQGLTGEEYEEKEKLEKKKKRELTDEEKARLEELKKKKKVQQDAISILRGISIRMPLLIYGARIDNEDEQLTIDNFTSLVDAQSWEEFMPRGVTKATFNKFKRYYDSDIFAAAGKRIRAMARAADRITIEERIERITDIFSTFRNPDKETVLTPWRVVNMHMSDTLGGYTFFNDDFSETITEPRYIDRGAVTADVFSSDSRLLEINSKTGLYPLYLAYNVYRTRLKDCTSSPSSLEEHLALWDAAVAENIFVICKTPMAKAITRRTLLGFRRGSVNMWAPEDLINKIKNQPELFIKKVHDLVGKDVKINAIVGNPPYQEMDGGAGASAVPVYNCFMDISKNITPSYISLIMPSRWMTGGRGLDKFRMEMLNDRRLILIHDYFNGRDIFENVEIKGGVCYFLWGKKYNDVCMIVSNIDDEIIKSHRFLKESNDDDIFIRHPRLVSIKAKVSHEKSFDILVSSMKPYGLRGDFFQAPDKYGLPAIYDQYINGGCEIIGLNAKQRRISKFVSSDYPFPQAKGLDDYKIFVPRNYGIGLIGEAPANPIKANPKQACTETFIQFGPFRLVIERDNCYKYMCTKFFRCLVSIRKSDQGAGRNVYHYVPLQNFTTISDIDWSRSISKIDAQLYAKYGLSDEEITFIESMIKPM